MILRESSFADAKHIFQEFLRGQNVGSDIVWLFFDDVFLVNGTVYVRSVDPAQNEVLANRLYDLGVARNLGLCLYAFARMGSKVCCYVDLPTDPRDAELRMFGSSLKCSIRNPLMEAIQIDGKIKWKIKHLLNGGLNELLGLPGKP